MPTVHCECGEPVHYSEDKAGLTARCRCGRSVRLPQPPKAPKPHKPSRTRKRQRRPLTPEEQFEEERRAADVRRQILAVLVAFAVMAFAVFIVIKASSTTRQAPPSAEASEAP